MLRAMLLIFVAAGCTTSADSPTRDGLYGVLFQSSDIAGQPDAPLAGEVITAFDATTMAQVATDTTRDDGSYVLALPAGTYVICAHGAAPATLVDQWRHNCAGACTRIAFTTPSLEANWGANLSGGLWDQGDHCPR